MDDQLNILVLLICEHGGRASVDRVALRGCTSLTRRPPFAEVQDELGRRWTTLDVAGLRVTLHFLPVSARSERELLGCSYSSAYCCLTVTVARAGSLAGQPLAYLSARVAAAATVAVAATRCSRA